MSASLAAASVLWAWAPGAKARAQRQMIAMRLDAVVSRMLYCTLWRAAVQAQEVSLSAAQRRAATARERTQAAATVRSAFGGAWVRSLRRHEKIKRNRRCTQINADKAF